jgi:quinol monooxygenase YgiN
LSHDERGLPATDRDEPVERLLSDRADGLGARAGCLVVQAVVDCPEHHCLVVVSVWSAPKKVPKSLVATAR